MPNPINDDRDRPSADWKRPSEPPIHRAARKGDIKELARLIEADADVDERADLEFDNGPHLNGLTPLMVAARSIDGATTKTLRWLAQHGADINARSKGDNTAAWYAAGHGGRWAFHKKAVTDDHRERLRYLLDLGMNPHECNYVGRSLMTESCGAGDPARLRLLLEQGVSIDPVSKPEQLNRQFDYYEKIVSDYFDADIPRGDFHEFVIPLFCAASSGSAETVQLLLDSGANPNIRDRGSLTPLMKAGSPEVAKTLLDTGADLHARDGFGNDAFDSLLEDDCCGGVCGPERFHTIQVFIEAGSDINRRDRDGKSRLASAAFRHQDDAVEFLLKIGADPQLLDSDGGSPLHSICWQGEYKDDDDTNRACKRIIELLVKAGISVKVRDSSGFTPLHESVGGDWGNPTAVKTLLRLGADPDPISVNGHSPLSLARYESGEIECIKLLKEAIEATNGKEEEKKL